MNKLLATLFSLFAVLLLSSANAQVVLTARVTDPPGFLLYHFGFPPVPDYVSASSVHSAKYTNDTGRRQATTTISGAYHLYHNAYVDGQGHVSGSVERVAFINDTVDLMSGETRDFGETTLTTDTYPFGPGTYLTIATTNLTVTIDTGNIITSPARHDWQWELASY
jgi:hypothetical protein